MPLRKSLTPYSRYLNKPRSYARRSRTPFDWGQVPIIGSGVQLYRAAKQIPKLARRAYKSSAWQEIAKFNQRLGTAVARPPLAPVNPHIADRIAVQIRDGLLAQEEARRLRVNVPEINTISRRVSGAIKRRRV